MGSCDKSTPVMIDNLSMIMKKSTRQVSISIIKLFTDFSRIAAKVVVLQCGVRGVDQVKWELIWKQWEILKMFEKKCNPPKS